MALEHEHSWMVADRFVTNSDDVTGKELEILSEREDINLVSQLGLSPAKDGDKWFFLWGEDLQNGVAGFGDTVHDAVLDFNRNYYGKPEDL